MPHTLPTPHRLDEFPEDACPACRGLGQVWLSRRYRCRECLGTGKVRCEETTVKEHEEAV